MSTKTSSKTFYILNHLVLAFFAAISLLPFFLVVITSFTPEKNIMVDGYRLIPKSLSLDAYRWVLGTNSTVYNAYKVSIFVTATATAGSILLVSMLAYAASRKNLRYRNVLSMIAYIPVVFYSGLIPFYMVLIHLGLKDKIIGLIIPILIAPMNVFLMLNYFRGLPEAVMESAKIDGASDFTTYRLIVMPMSGPVIATVALFTMLQVWNDWVLALLLIEDPQKYPLQFLLRQIMARVSYAQQQNNTVVQASQLPQESVKMATVVVTIGPIVFVYPYIQKYFIKGITIGAIKG